MRRFAFAAAMLHFVELDHRLDHFVQARSFALRLASVFGKLDMVGIQSPMAQQFALLLGRKVRIPQYVIR